MPYGLRKVQATRQLPNVSAGESHSGGDCAPKSLGVITDGRRLQSIAPPARRPQAMLAAQVVPEPVEPP